MWERGPWPCPAMGTAAPQASAPTPGRRVMPRRRQPRSSGKNAGIRAAICAGVSSPIPPPPAQHMASERGSFGKHLQTYGSFLSQGFFNSLCFLVFFGGRSSEGVLRGGVLFCLGGGEGCRLLLQKAWLGKKTKRGGPSGGIKGAAKQLVPNSCPLQRD